MIEIKNLNKSFGKKSIFHQFTYQFHDGKMTAIVGKSGCGKTTMLNMLGLLDLDYVGEILYDGKNIAKEKEQVRSKFIREHIGYLFQNYALIDQETVEENLLLAMEYESISTQEKQKRIQQALQLVELEHYNDKEIYTLSGGEQQRIALARILLKKGDIVLADEPTGNLDEENGNKVMNILKHLQSMGKTVIVVTHNEQLAKQCDEILAL